MQIVNDAGWPQVGLAADEEGGALGIYNTAENGDEALSRIAALRCLDPAGDRKSPETPEQRDMVRTWQSES